uniref:G-protein coupled receptors family 1 profile domain-containing protein n=1 Tax=Amphilophus citrinellus TaxID=61819 RepID=A0A3Q0SQ17_AMPCI
SIRTQCPQPPSECCRKLVLRFLVHVLNCVSHQVGLSLNGFIMKFYFCGARQQASSNLMIYMKNLTAADFLLCLSLPLRITHYGSISVNVRKLYCSFGASVLFLNMYASILFMGYIAANRYLKIVHPSRTHILQTLRAAHIISVVTWICLLAPALTSNILFFLNQKPLTSVPWRCFPLYSESVCLVQKIIHSFSAIIFLLVLISLVFFYYSTSHRVFLAQQKQLTSSGSEKLLKSRRNMLVLVSIFCVCFAPYHLIRLPYIFLQTSCSVRQVLYYLKEVATMVSVFNVCLDPLVYFFLCKTVRARVSMKMASIRPNIHHRDKQMENRKKQLESLKTKSETNQ